MTFLLGVLCGCLVTIGTAFIVAADDIDKDDI